MEETNTKKSEAALREERVLEFWKENKIFEKSLKQTEGKNEFIFYDGPVTANSKPVLHTMVPFSFKDIIPRYKTMRGYHVRRKGGWDTHGLPVELQIEKKLGFKSKNDIENYGVAAFNKLCKESVWEYVELWKNFTSRIGYWADQDNAYVTYHNNYIESVWNIVKKINEQNLLYKDYKVVPWCPRCGTVLSSHELAQGYEDVKDLSVTAKFRVLGENIASAGSLSVPAGTALPLGSSACETPGKSDIFARTYILAWTTTPWTLPGNVALAVGKNIVYVKIKVGNEIYILAKARLSVVEGEYEVLEELKGSDLVGLEYEPLYPFLKSNISELEKPKLEKAYKVYEANFVNTEDGTGVVHTAVMYGQDDFVLGTEIGLPKHHLVGLDGKFLSGTGIFEGRFVKDEEVAVDIIKDLAHRGLLFKKEKYEHSYPHCWRCHTALIYYARDSWYIKVSDPKIKAKMIAENKDINWEPSHIRDGRFGEWLREIKDWAISRERYWGTPLPVWECTSCKKREVLGSMEEIKEKTKKSGNKYFIMRHGEADNNIYVNNLHYQEPNHTAGLTKKGEGEVLESAKKLDKKIDVVICSTLRRAKQTTKIICKEIGFPIENVIYDERITEQETSSIFEHKDKAIFKKYYDEDYLDKPTEVLPDGESFLDVIKRTGAFIYELDAKYANKNILIIGHANASYALSFAVQGMLLKALSSLNNPFPYFNNAEIREFDFVPLPHNENFELDLHRPYIDEINLVCAHSIGSGQVCGGNLVRTKEVMDVWFDSGAMPFAQDHYPFENKNWVEGAGYPADYISEAIDQTRGWFYTLHAIGTLMGRGKAYKNVICLGHLMDASGKKMSKSVGNVVDPWEAMDKYGVDTLRLWMYSVNQPGESKNFDEKTVALLHQQVFGLLYNILAFYELYRDKKLEIVENRKSDNILDIWILERLDELVELTTKNLDNYKLLEPTRALRDFIGDLSTWYLRRSRERIKGTTEIDKINDADKAKQTLYFVLKTFAKLLAPFAPFTAEDVWLKLKNENDVESVHLASWPKKASKLFSFGKIKTIENMQRTREIVTLGLEARQKAGLKVRQPLSKLEVKDFILGSEYVELIKDEINVKEVTENKNIEGSVLLDVEINEDLKQEGYYRELARALQEMRKKIGLTPSDVVKISFETNDAGKKLIEKFESDMKKTVMVSKIEYSARGGSAFGGNNTEGEEIKIDELIFKVKIEK